MTSPSLPPSYLRYSKRRYGQDHDRYDWAFQQRVQTNNIDYKAGMFIVVPLEKFLLNPKGEPFRAPGSMVTHYPDLRHYTSRDYGNRIGAFRILKILRALDLKATFAVNARLLKSVSPLIDRIRTDGHEIAAYSLDMDCIHWGELDQNTEKTWVANTREIFHDCGLNPSTWMSPARQQSNNTLDIIAEHGFTSCLDWEFDCAPKPMQTKGGSVTMLPLLNELDDRKILIEKRHSETQWKSQITEAASYSTSIASPSTPQCFGITLTPYVAGLPFRISALDALLEQVRSICEINTADFFSKQLT